MWKNIGKFKKFFFASRYLKIIQDKKLSTTNPLNNFYEKIYSQNGEDGVINAIFNDIGFERRISVEIGAEWEECNSRNLIENYGFKGILIDTSISKKSKHKNAIFIKEWVTIENINNLISEKVRGDIDFLSIDLDGIDFHLMNQINVISPRVICIEYCASLGNQASLTVPYKYDFDKIKEHKTQFYYGASLKAYINLLKKKGYRFVGTVYGLNAFFIRENCKLKNFKELTCDEGYEPHYGRTYIRGLSEKDQFDAIKNLNWLIVGEDGLIKNIK